MRAATLAFLLLAALPSAVWAQTLPPPDDKVSFSLQAEDWVKTDTARVTIGVEAAVTGSTASDARGEMQEAVSGIAKGDWRLTGFSRAQDRTGMERWSAAYEARLPENKLSGLAEAAKKRSKEGMQLSVVEIAFTPTLAEFQKGYAALRGQLYEEVKRQQAILVVAMPEKTYRIAEINFMESREAGFMPHAPRMAMMSAKMVNTDMAENNSTPPMEKAEKIVLTAHVVLAAAAPKAP